MKVHIKDVMFPGAVCVCVRVILHFKSVCMSAHTNCVTPLGGRMCDAGLHMQKVPYV